MSDPQHPAARCDGADQMAVALVVALSDIFEVEGWPYTAHLVSDQEIRLVGENGRRFGLKVVMKRG